MSSCPTFFVDKVPSLTWNFICPDRAEFDPLLSLANNVNHIASKVVQFITKIFESRLWVIWQTIHCSNWSCWDIQIKKKFNPDLTFTFSTANSVTFLKHMCSARKLVNSNFTPLSSHLTLLFRITLNFRIKHQTCSTGSQSGACHRYSQCCVHCCTAPPWLCFSDTSCIPPHVPTPSCRCWQ